jgi:spore coat protein U-like protein
VHRTLGRVATFVAAACLMSGPVSAGPNIPVARSGATHPLGACSARISSFSFPSFSPLTHQGRFAQGFLTFDCASAVANIELSAGNSGQFRDRRMTAGGDPRATLSYNIYLDPNHTLVFGDGTAGSSTYVPGANVTKGGFPIYGAIGEGQTNLHVAAYSDTISITVNLAP